MQDREILRSKDIATGVVELIEADSHAGAIMQITKLLGRD
jgi:hypothetical protein